MRIICGKMYLRRDLRFTYINALPLYLFRVSSLLSSERSLDGFG